LWQKPRRLKHAWVACKVLLTCAQWFQGSRGLARGCMAIPSAMPHHCMHAVHVPCNSRPHQASGGCCERSLGGWITPPQRAASVQQHARHQSTINGLWMKEDRFTTFGQRWRPGDAADDAAGRQGWGEADRARALIALFSGARLRSESGNRRIVHARTCVKVCSREGFHCAWLQSFLWVFGVYLETMAATAWLQQQGGCSSITEKSPHTSMHGHGPQPWEGSTCGVWTFSSPPLFRGLGPAQRPVPVPEAETQQHYRGGGCAQATP